MLPIRNMSSLLPMFCSFWEKCKNSPKTGLGCSTPLNKRMKHHWVQNAALRALLRHVLPNYISFTTSLISASQKTCAFYVNELSIGPCMCYTRRVSLPLTKWNLPVPCKLGRETRCVLQNWNGIFPTSELSFTQGVMNELMTDWWRIIINNI